MCMFVCVLCWSYHGLQLLSVSYCAGFTVLQLTSSHVCLHVLCGQMVQRETHCPTLLASAVHPLLPLTLISFFSLFPVYPVYFLHLPTSGNRHLFI